MWHYGKITEKFTENSKDMKSYRYILQPYKGTSTRHTCPACNHKGEFSLYIDTETGEPVNESVGKCNREMNCGYHYTPAEFFKDNPDSQQPIAQRETKQIQQPISVEIPKEFIPTQDCIEHNNLFVFMTALFGEQTTRNLFETYKVGTSKHWRNDGGYSCVFPQIDKGGKLRQLKVIAYNPSNGKRLHKEHFAEKHTKNGYIPDEGGSDKVWFAGKHLLNDFNAQLTQCFFGEHLIAKHSIVGIVESEKTAMIASIYFPDCVWLATGGKNGCKWTSESVAKVLKGKTVVLYPDLKCFDEWTAKADKLNAMGINTQVSSLLERTATEEERERGLDLADFLIKQAETNRHQPKAPQEEIKPQHEQDSQTKPILTFGDLFATLNELGITPDRVYFDAIRGRISIYN